MLDWIRCEEAKTSCTAGIKAYAVQMLRNYSGGGGGRWMEADMEKVLL